MADQAQIKPIHLTLTPSLPETAPGWSLATRIAFRFCFVYCILAWLSEGIITALLPIPGLEIPGLGALWPLRQITSWAGIHLFRMAAPFTYAGGSDSAFSWVSTFCSLVIAALTTAIWSVFGRRRESYATLHKWFRLFLRFVLASVLFGYGFFKVIPLQMAQPTLVRLMDPFGHLSRGALLFWSIGAARPYEIFTGLVEVLAGVLLILPRTTALGALVSLAATTEVFALNMGYNFIVKLFSFHLVFFSFVLVAPDAKRILNFFFSRRAIALSHQPALFQSPRANRISLMSQVLFGLFLMGMNIHTDIHLWHTRGGGRPKPSLYGIWDVDQMSIDGAIRAPLLTDNDRWRRILFDYTTSTSFQRMDDSFLSFGSSISETDKTITFTKAGDQNWKASFKFERPSPDQLVLDGTMDGHTIHLQLKLFGRKTLPLVNDSFHWISQ